MLEEGHVTHPFQGFAEKRVGLPERGALSQMNQNKAVGRVAILSLLHILTFGIQRQLCALLRG